MDQESNQNSLDVQGSEQEQNAAGQKIKSFNQDEVNKIVRERLAKEKTKIDTEREAKYQERDAEFNKRDLTLQAREKLFEKGLPAELLEALNLSDAESLDKSLEVIGQFVLKNKEEPKPNMTPGFHPVIGATSGSTYSKDPYREAMGLE